LEERKKTKSGGSKGEIRQFKGNILGLRWKEKQQKREKVADMKTKRGLKEFNGKEGKKTNLNPQ